MPAAVPETWGERVRLARSPFARSHLIASAAGRIEPTCELRPGA